MILKGRGIVKYSIEFDRHYIEGVLYDVWPNIKRYMVNHDNRELATKFIGKEVAYSLSVDMEWDDYSLDIHPLTLEEYYNDSYAN